MKNKNKPRKEKKKQKKKVKLKGYESHHIIPKSRGGKNGLKNRIIVEEKLHMHWHGVVVNATPVESLIYITNTFFGGNYLYLIEAATQLSSEKATHFSS